MKELLANIESPKKIIKQVTIQQKIFPDANLGRNDPLQKFCSMILDELLFVGGWLQKTNIHQNHYQAFFTMQVIDVLSSRVQRYWMIHAHVAFRHVMSRCFQCKIQNCYQAEQMIAPLTVEPLTPDERRSTEVDVD